MSRKLLNWRRQRSTRCTMLRVGAFEPLESRRLMAAVPIYHSLPGAPATLYLDFDGHFQSSWGSYTNITTPPYDIDSDTATFSDTELANILQAWQIVADDYSLFNIDVTTEEPPVLAPGVPSSQANGVALRVAIGGNSDWYGASVGGVSYVNSFTSSVANVAYVFAATSPSANSVGNTSSHEAGHAFGLDHQYTFDASGVGLLNAGTSSWYPLMGFPATSKAATWHNGTDEFGPTSFQDDIAVLARSTNRFGYAPDDHSNSISGATTLLGSGVSFTGSGVVGGNGDVDFFSFTTAEPLNLRIAVDGPVPLQNLDAVIELYDAVGTLVARSDPSDSLDAAVFRSVSGTHYVAVTSNGLYGRVGQYSLTVSETTESLARVRVSSSSKPHTTSESGRAETITIALESRPAADVTLGIASSDASEGAVSASAIVFTPTNWMTPQTIAISGADEAMADPDESYTVTIAAAVSADPVYSGLDLDDFAFVNLDNDSPGYVYWLDNGADTVNRSSLAGEHAEALVDINAHFGSTGSMVSVAIDPVSGKLYWTDMISKTIRRANLDGSSPETIHSGLVNPSGIAVDTSTGKVYWTDRGADKIQRSNLDGSGLEDVLANVLDAREIKLDVSSGQMYWTDFASGTISRANVDGSNIELLIPNDTVGQPNALDLDLADGKLYFGTRLSTGGVNVYQIYRSDLDGQNLELLVDATALDTTAVLNKLAIDHQRGRLYWSDTGTDSVFSANLDGSGIAAVAQTPNPAGIAILSPTPGITVSPTIGLVTSESGTAASFTVVLNAPPTVDVEIPLSSSDATEGIVSVASLNFTTANWSVPQTVMVNAADDTTPDGDVGYTITIGPATSADPRYNGMDAADASVTNLDNDAPSITFYVVNDASQNRTYEYDPAGALVESYSLNGANSAPRGAASSAAGNKTWVVDANKKVYVYDDAGAILGSWTAGGLHSRAQIEGIATDGTDVWIVDAYRDRVYRYTGAASRLSGSQNSASSFALNSGNRDPKDLVTDGTHLWVVNDNSTDKVFKYTLSGLLVGSWTISSGGGSPTGVTIDSTNVSDIWIVDSFADRVYQYSAAATRTSGSQSPAASFALAAGNTNPQGIADPPTPLPSGAHYFNAFQVADRSNRTEKNRVSSRFQTASIDLLYAEPESTWTRKSRIKLRT